VEKIASLVENIAAWIVVLVEKSFKLILIVFKIDIQNFCIQAARMLLASIYHV